MNFGDEGLDGGLAFGVAAAGHDRGEVVADQGNGAGRWWGRLGGQTGGEFGVPGMELGQLLADFPDARAGGGVVHGAVLERGVIPVDGSLGGGDLVGEGGEFSASVVGGAVALGISAFDHGAQDGLGGGVEVVQRGEDGVVEVVGG
ncbi:hypothetical protein LQ51_04890 [Micromonospora sp. HK10]|nr:hypothetical protein LQ51_04890 [Micromonospora sp. HK10]